MSAPAASQIVDLRDRGVDVLRVRGGHALHGDRMSGAQLDRTDANATSWIAWKVQSLAPAIVDFTANGHPSRAQPQPVVGGVRIFKISNRLARDQRKFRPPQRLRTTPMVWERQVLTVRANRAAAPFMGRGVSF